MSRLNVASVAGLPFSAEPILLWAEKSDLFSFLRDLHEGVPDYGKDVFERGRNSFEVLAAEFGAIAEERKQEPIPDEMGPMPSEEVIDFRADGFYGLMAKHAVACDAVVGELLSESCFFSLPHILEAREELECSVLLAKNCYYKQALQVLRSLLELNVLHLYFTGDQAAYGAWQNGDYRVPRLRGRGGLVEVLCEKGVISTGLGKEVSELYEALNGTIHSSEKRMVNRGLRDRRWAGLQFKRDEFQLWCEQTSAVVTVSVKLLSAMSEELARHPDAGIVCCVCRAVNQFSVEDRSSNSVTLRCCRCGQQNAFSAEYAKRHGF